MIVYWKFPIMIWAFNLQSEKDNICIIRIEIMDHYLLGIEV